MATQSSTAPARSASATVHRSAARSGYFFWTSVLLLAFVLIGFAPTLYLRSFFSTAEPNMPLYLYLHGAVLTAWFAWLVSQTWLVRAGRTSTHRRLGWAGAALAVGICLVGPMATLGVVGRIRAAGLDFDTDMSALPFLGVEGVTMLKFAAPLVWGNLVSIVVFAGLVGAAVAMRGRAEHHKRLMIIASISLVVPALARISRWPVFGGEDGPFLPLAGLGLLLSVTVFDLLTRKKPHRATVIGTLAVVAGIVVSNMVSTTPWGQAFVRSLG